jgi:hypothetical protein
VRGTAYNNYRGTEIYYFGSSEALPSCPPGKDKINAGLSIAK